MPSEFYIFWGYRVLSNLQLCSKQFLLLYPKPRHTDTFTASAAIHPPPKIALIRNIDNMTLNVYSTLIDAEQIKSVANINERNTGLFCTSSVPSKMKGQWFGSLLLLLLLINIGNARAFSDTKPDNFKTASIPCTINRNNTYNIVVSAN